MRFERVGKVAIELTPGEAIGLATVLWELGTAVKATTGDPECLAAEVYGEAAWIETQVGLPAWPTNAKTRQELAEFYERGARQPGLDGARAAAVVGMQIGEGDARRIVDVARRIVAAIGTDGLTVSAVSIGARGLAWTQLLLCALNESDEPSQRSSAEETLQRVIRESAEVLRQQQDE